MKAIINGNILFNGTFHNDLIIVFSDKINNILSKKDFASLDNSDFEIIDAKNNYVLPGFIDVHIHGFNGFDTMDATTKAIDSIRQGITSCGVTSFLPTTMTMTVDKINKAINNVASCQKKPLGAKILGVHLEGPYINHKYKGAQDSTYIIDPNIEFINSFKDIIKIITIAPELNDGLKTIEKFSNIINFSIGHSNATYDIALDAYNRGATGITHLFNAMTPLNHRKPGVVGCALTKGFYTELIADNIHVSKDLYTFIYHNKTIDKILLVSDAIKATNMPDGIYSLGGQKVTVNNNKCLLDNGTIAGSTLKLNNALKNFTNATSLPLSETIKTVTINQAKYLGLDKEIGTLDINKKADIIIMDTNFKIKNTFVEGELYYEI